jgi:hypothetical protein
MYHIYLHNSNTTCTQRYVFPLLAQQVTEEPLCILYVTLQHASAMRFRH